MKQNIVDIDIIKYIPFSFDIIEVSFSGLLIETVHIETDLFHIRFAKKSDQCLVTIFTPDKILAILKNSNLFEIIAFIEKNVEYYKNNPNDL